MAKVNLSKAALLAGKNRTTIWRHIKQGRLSIERDRDGNPLVDTSELIRVYGELKPIATQQSEKIQHQATIADYAELVKVVEQLRREQSEMKEIITDLRNRLEYTPTSNEKNIKADNATHSNHENDPEWPIKAESLSDLLKRNEIRERYKSKN